MARQWNKTWQEYARENPNTFKFHSFSASSEKKDDGTWLSTDANNPYKRGTIEEANAFFMFFEKEGRIPTLEEFKLISPNSNRSSGGFEAAYENIKTPMIKYLNSEGITPNQAIDGIQNQDGETPLNPYVKYLEEQRLRQENAELGLLNEQTNIGRQNADINAQQMMMQQGQLKDQLVEQIKSDRLSKMRSGLSPMQIAQDNLQFMVGNMQMNNMEMSQANQQRLMMDQQGRLNPYQAYLNSVQAVTGGQGQANFAAGMAATDAGDLTMQMGRLNSLDPRLPLQQRLYMAQGTLDPYKKTP